MKPESKSVARMNSFLKGGEKDEFAAAAKHAKEAAELRVYFTDLIARLKALHQTAQARVKTTKARCADITISLLLRRAESIRELILAGGSGSDVSVSNVDIQKALYEAPIEYWSTHLTKKDDGEE